MHRDNLFGGSVAEIYETCMVPMLFEQYAADLARRVCARACRRVLEVGAGTGALTRALAAGLPPETTIVATDLNQAMLDRAAAVGGARAVEWRHADAGELPFADGSFDVVVCQFAVMFFPDKARAFSEVRRVLAPGGVFLFNVWDRIEDNEFTETVTEAVGAMFPDDPPRFMVRTPHGYYDRTLIERDLAAGGFVALPHVETITARSHAPSALAAAMALCQGTPLRTEIEARDSGRLEEATAAAAAALSTRFGAGAIAARMQAHGISVER